MLISSNSCSVACINNAAKFAPAEKALLDSGFTQSDLSGLTLYGPSTSGCTLCTQGYKGRIGLFEIMPITSNIAELIMSGGNALAIRQEADKAGLFSLRTAGLDKVKKGMTSLEEVHRVTKL